MMTSTAPPKEVNPSVITACVADADIFLLLNDKYPDVGTYIIRHFWKNKYNKTVNTPYIVADKMVLTRMVSISIFILCL